MLDTIVLTLDRQQFEFASPALPVGRGPLVPPYYRLGMRGHFACFQNPTRRSVAGPLSARLTLSKRRHRPASRYAQGRVLAPKLVFGNNLTNCGPAISSTCSPHCTDHSRVWHRIAKTVAAGAGLGDHYSKNIAFTDFDLLDGNERA